MALRLVPRMTAMALDMMTTVAGASESICSTNLKSRSERRNGRSNPVARLTSRPLLLPFLLLRIRIREGDMPAVADGILAHGPCRGNHLAGCPNAQCRFLQIRRRGRRRAWDGHCDVRSAVGDGRQRGGHYGDAPIEAPNQTANGERHINEDPSCFASLSHQSRKGSL
jgi:hypothetical protein